MASQSTILMTINRLLSRFSLTTYNLFLSREGKKEFTLGEFKKSKNDKVDATGLCK